MRLSKEHKIASYQLFFIVTLIFNGAYSLIMQNILGRHVKGADGILCMLGAFVLGIGVLIFVHYIGKALQYDNLISFLPKIMGKKIGKLVGFMFAFYFSYAAIFYLKCFDEMLVAELLPNTPRWILSLALLLLVLWIINNGLEDIARFYTLLGPIVITMLLAVLVANSGNFRWYNALPFGESDPSGFLSGVQAAFPIFLINITLLVVYPAVNQPQKILKVALGGMTLSAVYLMIMFLFILGVFGNVNGLKIVWPLIELSRMIRIGPFLERVEAVFILVWFSIAFLNGSFLTYCSTTSWQALFNVQKAKRFNVLVVGVLFIVSLFAKDLKAIFIMQYWFSRYVAISVVILLLLTAAAVWLQKRRRRAHE